METNGNTKIVDFKTHLRRVTIYAVKHALSCIVPQTIKNVNTKIVTILVTKNTRVLHVTIHAPKRLVRDLLK